MSTVNAAGVETIITADPSGGNVRDLHANGECSEWSPDGTRIAYCHQTNTANRFDIYVMNADGSGQRRLTATPGDDNPGAWSPDGTRLAFSSQRDGNYDVFVMNIDGSNVHQLTSDPCPEAAAAWLKDGRIVFARAVDQGPLPDWFVMNADGSNVRSIPWLKGAADPIDWIQP
jgi:TolB protein